MNPPVLIDAATFWRKVEARYLTVEVHEGFAFTELDGFWFTTRLANIEAAA